MCYQATATQPAPLKGKHSITGTKFSAAPGMDKIDAALAVAAQSALKSLPCVCIPALGSDFERKVFESSTMWSICVCVENIAKRIRGFTVYRDRHAGDIWVYDAFFRIAAHMGQTSHCLKDLEQKTDRDIRALFTLLRPKRRDD